MCAASSAQNANAKASKSPARNLAPRFEPPTLEDALYAAEGLTDDPAQQIELAAELMHLPVEQVRAAAAPLLKAKTSRVTISTGRRAGAEVIVEMRSPRRVINIPPRTGTGFSRGA